MSNPTVLENIGACVFDAYGTLFDVAAAAAHCKDDLGDKAAPLAVLWRDKQLQYTWLRTLMDDYADFWQVTTEALDYGLETLEISDAALRQKLLDLYFKLDAYTEVPDMLESLRAAGMKTAILSNGSPDMLKGAVDSAAIGGLLDAVLSVDVLKIYKPRRQVYQLAVDALSVEAGRICFLSSNGWDAAGAAHFGFKVVWINRAGLVGEKLPAKPLHELSSLVGLPGLLGL